MYDSVRKKKKKKKKEKQNLQKRDHSASQQSNMLVYPVSDFAFCYAPPGVIVAFTGLSHPPQELLAPSRWPRHHFRKATPAGDPCSNYFKNTVTGAS